MEPRRSNQNKPWWQRWGWEWLKLLWTPIQSTLSRWWIRMRQKLLTKFRRPITQQPQQSQAATVADRRAVARQAAIQADADRRRQADADRQALARRAADAVTATLARLAAERQAETDRQETARLAWREEADRQEAARLARQAEEDRRIEARQAEENAARLEEDRRAAARQAPTLLSQSSNRNIKEMLSALAESIVSTAGMRPLETSAANPESSMAMADESTINFLSGTYNTYTTPEAVANIIQEIIAKINDKLAELYKTDGIESYDYSWQTDQYIKSQKHALEVEITRGESRYKEQKEQKEQADALGEIIRCHTALRALLEDAPGSLYGNFLHPSLDPLHANANHEMRKLLALCWIGSQAKGNIPEGVVPLTEVIDKLYEIRTAHNADQPDLGGDSPSCFPGTKGRLVQLAKTICKNTQPPVSFQDAAKEISSMIVSSAREYIKQKFTHLETKKKPPLYSYLEKIYSSDEKLSDKEIQEYIKTEEEIIRGYSCAEVVNTLGEYIKGIQEGRQINPLNPQQFQQQFQAILRHELDSIMKISDAANPEQNFIFQIQEILSKGDTLQTAKSGWQTPLNQAFWEVEAEMQFAISESALLTEFNEHFNLADAGAKNSKARLSAQFESLNSKVEAASKELLTWSGSAIPEKPLSFNPQVNPYAAAINAVTEKIKDSAETRSPEEIIRESFENTRAVKDIDERVTTLKTKATYSMQVGLDSFEKTKVPKEKPGHYVAHLISELYSLYIEKVDRKHRDQAIREMQNSPLYLSIKSMISASPSQPLDILNSPFLNELYQALYDPSAVNIENASVIRMIIDNMLKDINIDIDKIRTKNSFSPQPIIHPPIPILSAISLRLDSSLNEKLATFLTNIESKEKKDKTTFGGDFKQKLVSALEITPDNYKTLYAKIIDFGIAAFLHLANLKEIQSSQINIQVLEKIFKLYMTGATEPPLIMYGASPQPIPHFDWDYNKEKKVDNPMDNYVEFCKRLNYIGEYIFSFVKTLENETIKELFNIGLLTIVPRYSEEAKLENNQYRFRISLSNPENVFFEYKDSNGNEDRIKIASNENVFSNKKVREIMDNQSYKPIVKLSEYLRREFEDADPNKQQSYLSPPRRHHRANG